MDGQPGPAGQPGAPGPAGQPGAPGFAGQPGFSDFGGLFNGGLFADNGIGSANGNIDSSSSESGQIQCIPVNTVRRSYNVIPPHTHQPDHVHHIAPPAPAPAYPSIYHNHNHEPYYH